MTRLILVSAAALALSACGAQTPRPQIRVNATVPLPVVPDSDFICAGEPAVPGRLPGSAKRTDSQLQNFILDLRNAGADCRDKLMVAFKTWRATEAEQARVKAEIDKLDTK